MLIRFAKTFDCLGQLVLAQRRVIPLFHPDGGVELVHGVVLATVSLDHREMMLGLQAEANTPESAQLLLDHFGQADATTALELLQASYYGLHDDEETQLLVAALRQQILERTSTSA